MNKEKLRTYAIYCSTAADTITMKDVLMAAGEHVFSPDSAYGAIPCHLRYRSNLYWVMYHPNRQHTSPSPIINFSDLVKDKS